MLKRLIINILFLLLTSIASAQHVDSLLLRLSKTGKDTNRINLQLQLGNDNFVRFPVDLSGPLTEDANLNYRLNTLYQYEESFRDLDNGFERFFVAPTLAWQIADNTDLSFNLEYTHETRPIDLGSR